jgi:hypothetical protein
MAAEPVVEPERNRHILAGDARSNLPLYAFEGFGSPVANDLLNTVKAGQTVPLRWRWRLLDPTGAPVTDLATASVAVRTVACGTLPPDSVEETAAGQSGLQNLGGGNYQFNWKTMKAPGCRELKLELPYQFSADTEIPTLHFELSSFPYMRQQPVEAPSRTQNGSG